MSSPANKEDRKENGNAPPRRNQGWTIILVLFAAVAAFLMFQSAARFPKIELPIFYEQVAAKNLHRVDVYDQIAYGTFKVPPEKPPQRGQDGEVQVPRRDRQGDPERYGKTFQVAVPLGDVSRGEFLDRLETLRAADPEFIYDVHPGDVAGQLTMFLFIGLGIATFVLLWSFLRRSRDAMMGGGFLSSFSRSTARRYESTDQQITFNDVAGLEGVKADLQEIVEFLKAPEKFQKLGGRVPKGVLLAGPPGTGKTLLARAVAGEAGVAFFSVNGSEFIQMFVGVGASRVRDLFQQAKETGAAIIFIDEIDAVGRQRGAGLGGGHDEREQTLNQILSEMDGFSPTDSVIVMAATNRPDVLDPALLRPGRFDRHVVVNRPTLKGRTEIFKVHVRDVPLDDDVDLKRLAEATVGMTGADIRNVVNEAALWAARNDRSRVGMQDFDYARDKVMMGAKREEVLSKSDLVNTAYHEAGHTLAAWHLPGAQRVYKVTVIPRGQSLGSTHIVPQEDRVSISEGEARDQLVVLLGGRAAEKVIFDETSAGAENDLERATSLARRMVGHWGMSAKIGPVSYKTSQEDPFLGREMHQQRQFSEHTQELIDAEVGDILRAAERRAIDLLHEKRHELELLKEALLQREELDENQITELIGRSVHANQPDDKEIPAEFQVSNAP